MTRLTPRREAFLLFAITALAAFLRLYRLESLPPGDGHDVAQYGVDALQILNGARPVFFETNFGREALFSYLVSLIFHFTGPTTYGIHLTSALIGTFTIPAIYLAARELFFNARDELLSWLPLLAALLAAFSYWHLNWSRVGLRVILVPLFAALIFFALWRGFRTGKWIWFAVSGGFLGLSLYTYQAARILPALMAFAFLLHCLLRRRWTQTDTKSLLLTAALFMLVAMPLVLYARQHPGALSVRIRQAVVVDESQPLGQQLSTLGTHAAKALLTYSFEGDTDPQFTIAGRPSLNPFLSISLFIGLLFAIWRFRTSPYLFLLFWLALMTAPALISDQAATAKRYLGAFPAVVMLVALGFLVPLELLRRSSPTRARQTGIVIYTILLVTGLIYSAFTTWRDYFVIWAADPDLPAHFQVDHLEIGKAIAAIEPEQMVWLSPYVADHPVIQFHAGLRPNLRGYNGRFCTPFNSPVREPGSTYLIIPGFQDQSLEDLKRLFPNGTITDGPLRPASDQPYYRTFFLPAGSDRGYNQEPIASWNEGLALLEYSVEPAEVSPGQTVSVTLTYQALDHPGVDYTAFVHLLGSPNSATGSPLWAQADSLSCGGTLPTGRWQPGDIIRDTITLQIPSDIPEGDYNLMTGFYTWPELTRLISVDSNSDAVPIGTLRVIPLAD